MFVSDTGRGSSLKGRDTEDLGSKAQLSSVVMNPRETSQHGCLFFSPVTCSQLQECRCGVARWGLPRTCRIPGSCWTPASKIHVLVCVCMFVT